MSRRKGQLVSTHVPCPHHRAGGGGTFWLREAPSRPLLVALCALGSADSLPRWLRPRPLLVWAWCGHRRRRSGLCAGTSGLDPTMGCVEGPGPGVALRVTRTRHGKTLWPPPWLVCCRPLREMGNETRTPSVAPSVQRGCRSPSQSNRTRKTGRRSTDGQGRSETRCDGYVGGAEATSSLCEMNT